MAMINNNPFKFSSDNKRYHTLSYHLKEKFGEKLYKAVLNAGFTCPNIDGTAGYGGCIYCIDGGSEFTSDNSVSVEEQLNAEIKRIYIKHPDSKIIAYFQSHTNTYASVDCLKKIYEIPLKNGKVAGISIATRADCIEDGVLDYLTQLSEKTYLTVELGLQTIHDETAEIINRCHTYSCFSETYKRLKDRGIRVCVHLIDGLCGETFDMMLETAKTVGELNPDGVKIHLLHIMKGTRLYEMYLKGQIRAMEFDEYVKTVCFQLTYLPPETVIERITGDGSKELLAAPLWSRDKIRVLGSIDKFMADNNLYQGMNLNKFIN